MNSMVSAIKKKKYGISQEVQAIFEGILQKYQSKYGSHLAGYTTFHPEWDDEFCQAMGKHLTKEQRFMLYETQGACNGTGADKQRKAFAADYAHLSIDEKMTLFAEKFDRLKPTLTDNTLSLTFKCSHGYYKRAREGKYTTPPPNIEAYFERCAGGRLYELQKALGVKLKIKSIDVSPLEKDVNNPVVFTFELLD
jgi:hypothetical protein